MQSINSYFVWMICLYVVTVWPISYYACYEFEPNDNADQCAF